ncbi:MAG: hypothetical protein ABSG16_22410 [Candidatus Acidiferrum sp.]
MASTLCARAQAADGFKESGDFFVVFAEAIFEFEQLESELVLGAKQFAQLDEGADDLNAGCTATGLLRTLASLTAPCSVKA